MSFKSAWETYLASRKSLARSLVAAGLLLALTAAAPWETPTETVPFLRLSPELFAEPATPTPGPPQEPAPVVVEEAPAPTPAPMDPLDAAKIDGIGRSMSGDAPASAVEAETPLPPREAFGLADMAVRTVMALCVALALVLLAYAALRKWGKGNPLVGGGEHASCIGRLYLDRNSRVHLVRVGGRVLVVGTAGSSVTLLADMDAAGFSQEPAAPQAPEDGPHGDSFYNQLQANLARINRQDQGPEDADIEEIRTEIVRLKRVLDEEPSEHGD